MQAIQSNLSISLAEISRFCRRWKIARLSLLGSVLRDDFRTDSDVDVLVALRKDAEWSLWDWIEMVDEIKLLFGREVDVVEESGLRNPFRRHEILRTRKVIYEQ
ncbi:MAG: nucleotidyltransferase family protein [Planctomycetaceae bacterium]